MSLNGTLLKQREQKYNDKLFSAIAQMKRGYRHLHFFNNLSSNVKGSLQSVILQQNRWLRIMQEEQPPIYDTMDSSQSTGATTTGAEQDHAAFYEQNQAWLLGEVENFISQQKDERAANHNEVSSQSSERSDGEDEVAPLDEE